MVRKIAGKTLMDRERREDIRRAYQIDNINDWVLKREKESNEHINRVTEVGIVKIIRDKSLIGRRGIGKPRKRWSENLAT